MQRPPTRPRRARLVACLASVAVGACAPDAALVPRQPHDAAAILAAAPGTASAPAPDRRTARWEIDFMQDMIDHHMMAVMTARVCVEKAVHEELRALCQDIIAAQSAEMEQMQSWLRQWYGVSHEPRMTPGMELKVEKLASLSGAEFEIAFMEMMIRHHEKAIKKGEECLDRAYHAELRQLCENIIAAQTEEIARMRAWLCEWYGECAKR